MLIIYYFSGTGNCLYAAKYLKKSIPGSSIAPMAKHKHATSEHVGFVFPLYYYSMPELVKKFIKEHDFSETKYTFALISRGTTMSGGALPELKSLLRKKGVPLDTGMYLDQVDNYTPMLSLPSEIKQKQINKRADLMLKVAASKIKTRQIYYERKFSSILRPILKRLMGSNIPDKDKKYTVNKDCNNCGLCEKICPVNNIVLKEGRPTWIHKCEHCLACIHFCPTNAIHCGNGTKNKGQFHNPNIKVSEMFNQKP